LSLYYARFSKLPDSKVQAPESGCLVGFRKPYIVLGGEIEELGEKKRLQELYKSAKNLDEFTAISIPFRQKTEPGLIKNINTILSDYQQGLLNKPKIFVLMDTPRMYGPFRHAEGETLAAQGIIPFIYAGIGLMTRPEFSLKLEDIVNSKHDKYFINFAQGSADFGKKYGGFFITTMEENNADWNYWGLNPKFIPAWRHIWKIFEDQGANQYATWIWEIYCPEGAKGRTVHPDQMYPGDKYVDWIGLSAFSRRHYGGGTFGFLAGKTYEEMFKNHRNKPIMQSEFGVTNDGAQPRWLLDAYKTIKSMPAMKAAIFWDHEEGKERDDHTLSKKSLQAMKDIFKDSYWIMTK